MVKIIYRQPDITSAMDKMNISECCLKYIDLQRDIKNTTGKWHHHTETEIHIIVSGKQKYEFSDGIRETEAGMFLIIPPGVSHRTVGFADGSTKYSATFMSNEKLSVTVGKIGDNFMPEDIKAFAEDNRELSAVLLENRIFELILSVLRQSGFREKTVKIPSKTESRTELAKKYISDNIHRRITVSEVSSHVYICPKQLTRLFREYEGMTPIRYIEKEKCDIAMKLLRDNDIKVSKVGESLGFTEQYFNSFFKRNCGMSPGEYRKMNRQGE